uniref:Pro-opiomelanocortin/corticotropin ACTH central region domain-containing protein n=1 Tax=Xiphophorus couchianus TaxID=32473 RepID=A0A3B5LDX8_9TELE
SELEKKMVCQCWLFMVLMGFMCSSGSGSVCLESSTCNDLSNKDIIQDCLHLCTSAIEPETKPPRVTDQQENDDFDDPEESHTGDLLLSIILSTLASEGKVPEGDLKTHDDQRRSYAMEHFRWGKPLGRKRRPVKVFPSAVDEEVFPLRARRHLSWNKAESKGGRKAETYRMSHFRWGSPLASKQNNGFVKLWEEKPREKLSKLFKNILVKDLYVIHIRKDDV